MEKSDIEELMRKGRSDGAKLYSVADALHKLCSLLIGLVAVVGVVASFAAMTNAGFVAGAIVFIATTVLCMLLYAADVVLTNSSKVLVHLLFSNLVLIDKAEK